LLWSQLWLRRADVNREEEEKMEQLIPYDLLVLEHILLWWAALSGLTHTSLWESTGTQACPES